MLNVNLLSGFVFSPMIDIRFAVTPLTRSLKYNVKSRHSLNDVTRNILELGQLLRNTKQQIYSNH
ncbi:hypothetical protein T4B_4447, partial [Trichinella pseudospiralis]